MSTTLRIWTNLRCEQQLLPLLQQGIGRHELLFSRQLEKSVLVAAGADPLLAEADIAFGQPDPEQVITLPRLKWVHLSSAGYTRYDRDDLRQALASRGGQLTNSSTVYEEPCAQHALALILALARDLPNAVLDQHQHRKWPTAACRSASILLNQQSLLIVGYGTIGRRLAELLQPLRMKLVGVRRRPRGDEAIPVHAMDRLDELLPQADHIVNILPAARETQGLFDARRFKQMKPTARFYNIGRGDTVDQEALRNALLSNQLAAAFLDVTTPEPLPPEHPLWTTPNCHITPHTAGGHSNEYERLIGHFLANLNRYEAGEELIDCIV
jgi:phosphoglycerate dehydrogenase-like enzyme